ncbi:hypothetical protein [Pyrobaculum aerophilum]|uniref:Uncharacterized protein n=2 Tax=Pyrobaculum aerophilum TaxID=13773 RepID=Q8ZWP4_PYRAE|nr:MULTISPECIES: hypothetical protein [Pyrobaculum]AAL63656.1 hypothetical protein PAE1687 [Pyrobaculum aerophilum str. IM2]MCX8136450.1 hypothetical protein [Pyrobaculum aerophilum]
MDMNSGSRQLNIKIYRNKYRRNKCIIIIKDIVNKNLSIKKIPCDKVDIYIKKLLKRNISKKIKINDIEGVYIKINEKLFGTGWLFFPRRNLLIGAAFYGKKGIVASPRLPGRTAYFIPLDIPIISVLNADIIDFY